MSHSLFGASEIAAPDFFVIAGPTASGKSGFAVRLAEELDAEIIGADAFQLYAGLDLLTAKPTTDERARVPHHLIGLIPLTDRFDVARYVALARDKIIEIRGRGRLPLVVGGTGLYIRSLVFGLAEVPPADLALRAELEGLSLEILKAELFRLDPTGAQEIDLSNPRRVVRAVEVCRLSGRPFSSFRKPIPETLPTSHGIVLEWERGELHQRIEQRTKAMFQAGVIDEVEHAGALGPTAEQVLGYREIHAHLRGETSRDECQRLVTVATRQYAKRQETWFRKEPGLDWVSGRDQSAALAHCRALLRR
jgi:tRNA dimethylallyltransferase